MTSSPTYQPAEPGVRRPPVPVMPRLPKRIVCRSTEKPQVVQVQQVPPLPMPPPLIWC